MPEFTSYITSVNCYIVGWGYTKDMFLDVLAESIIHPIVLYILCTCKYVRKEIKEGVYLNI